MRKRTPQPAEPVCCSSLTGRLSPQLFKALSDPNRVSILARLAECGCEQTVSEVARDYAIDLSVVSRHLGLLRDAGVLAAERRGKQVFYRARIPEIVALLRSLADAFERCCPDGECAPGVEEGR